MSRFNQLIRNASAVCLMAIVAVPNLATAEQAAAPEVIEQGKKIGSGS